MKTRVTILKHLIILCGAIASTAVFGQTTYTWTGAGDGTNITNPANWTPTGGPPSGATQDTAQWDNQVLGNLLITYNNGLPGTGFGTSGINLDLTTNQVGSVDLVPVGGATGNIGINDISILSATAAFGLGDASTNVLNFIGRPAGGTHDFINDSAAGAAINANVRWQAGGGAVYTLLFDGPGNWNVTNSLANANNTGMLIAKTNSGTLFWNGPSIAGALGNSTINSPITITGGSLVLQWNNPLISSDAITNGGVLLDYDAPSQSQILGGVISGGGELQVNNGTLTLQGANTFTGNILLTSSGILVVNSAENPGTSGPLGVAGTILFYGGTLEFSVNNTFDYSSRFTKVANLQYNINVGGQSVTFGSALTSSGGALNLTGPGTLTLSGTNTYSGATTVNSGKLVFQGPMSGAGNITVADSAALGVTDNGTPLAPANLTLGTSAGATLEFNNVNSTATAPLAAGTLSSAGTVTVNINGGTFTVGQSYPLLTWTGGSAPTVSLGTLNGYVGNLSINGNSLVLSITATGYRWTGANNGDWDLTTANNWIQNGGPVVFADGGPALFDDTATEGTNVTVGALVEPTSVTVDNDSLIYTIASTAGDDIGGTASLTKSGTSTLTLSGGANTYTGGTTVGGGTLSVSTLANGGSASDIGAAANGAGNLVFNGGTLQYTGGVVSSDHLFTLGTGGGTIDSSGSGALELDNSGSVGFIGTGARTLTLTGADADTNTLAAALADNGGPTSVTKSGAGTWILTGNNKESGPTTIANGTLQVGAGAGGAIGSGGVVDNGVLDFNVSNTVTVGTISGLGSVTTDGSGTVILPGNNSYSGGTTINAGTLQIGNGGATGALLISSPVLDNGTFAFNSTGSLSLTGNGLISGAGQVIVSGKGGLLKAIGNNTYTGNTTINTGATFQPCEGNQGALASPFVTNNGTLKVVRQDNGVFIYTGNIVGSGSVDKDLNNTQPGDVTFVGSNTYTGGTLINGGAIILGDNSTPGAGTIVGNVAMTYNALQTAGSTLEFNHPDDWTFPGVINGVGSVLQNGNGRLTLTGTNSYSTSTTIASGAGALQVGAGGLTGSIGSGDVTNNSELDFDLSGNLAISALITGSGSVVQLGSGTVTLSDTNNYTGATIVSNGTLAVSTVPGDMDVSGGTLSPVVVASVAALNVAGNLNISSGSISVSLNTVGSPTNSVITVTGVITNTGGSLTLLNTGPSLTPGEQFTIFNQPVAGAPMTIVSPGLTFSNNLAVNGSVTVASVAGTEAGAITATFAAGQLNLSWPAASSGLELQVQTNSLGANWITIPGLVGVTSYSTAVNVSNVSVFYRLVSP